MKHTREDRTVHGRIEYVAYMLGFMFLFFLGLLIRYQIIDAMSGIKYVKPAFLQRQESVPVCLPRGRILDRNGVPLHCPYWHPALAVFPSKVDNKHQFVKQAASLTGIDEFRLRAMLETQSSPFKLIRELSAQELETVMSQAIPGLVVVPEEIRYGRESLARHVVGHIRPNAYLNQKDNIGESGLESWYQTELLGSVPAWAGTLVTGEGSEIPGTGVRIGSIGDYPKDLVTTIDANVQYCIEKVIDEEQVERGAIVVLDVKGGQVLAMASRPQYDQNHPEDYFELADAPFVNRGISDFAPGSIWKPIILALALEKGYVKQNDIFVCEGSIDVGSTTVKCGSSEKGHGKVTLKQAVAHSCNCALIQIALRIPPEELITWAKQCGFGFKTRIPLPQESPGVLPAPNLMLPGDVANYAIGQGYLTATPLQVCGFFRSVLDDGKWITPALVKGSAVYERAIFSASTARFLEDALLLATQEGTGQKAWVDCFGSAGKTGTAEISGESGLNHSWFVGWTPILDPQYLICVFIERAGDGPTLAAPLFKNVAEQLLKCS